MVEALRRFGNEDLLGFVYNLYIYIFYIGCAQIIKFKNLSKRKTKSRHSFVTLVDPFIECYRVRGMCTLLQTVSNNVCVSYCRLKSTGCRMYKCWNQYK